MNFLIVFFVFIFITFANMTVNRHHTLSFQDVDLATRPPTAAPLKIAGRRDGLNEELLRHLAHKLGDEWGNLAIKHLRVSRTTVNNCKKFVNNKDGSVDDIKFDVLVAWIKTQPRGESRVIVATTHRVHCFFHYSYSGRT